MEKMNAIAKDYLADFEVLTEARNEFEKALGDWWQELFAKRIEPELTQALKDVTGAKANVWENQSGPGLAQCRAVAAQEVLLQITDPRVSGRGCYTVSLLADKMPTLKKLVAKQTAYMDAVNELSRALSAEGLAVVKRVPTELVAVDVAINPDNFEDTARRVVGVAVRMFGLVIENHRCKGAEG